MYVTWAKLTIPNKSHFFGSMHHCWLALEKYEGLFGSKIICEEFYGNSTISMHFEIKTILVVMDYVSERYWKTLKALH